MKSGITVAFVGFVLGLVLGTALFGPIGGIVGAILGSILGFVIVMPIAVSYAYESAKTPFAVECPETHRDVQITLDPKKAGRAEFWNRKKKIETCTRFDGPPNCDQECLDQTDL